MRKKEVKQKRNITLVLIILSIIVILVLFNIQSKRGIKQDQKQDILVLLQLANELYSNNDYVNAIAQYKKIIEIDPKLYSAYLGLGHSYLQLGIYDGAIKTFEKTFETGYVDFRTYYGLGLTYYTMEDYNKAYTNLKQAYDLNPNNKAVVSYLINTYNAIGLYGEAIKLAKNKLETEPDNSHYYRKIGIAYFLKNDLNNALENAQKAVELDASYPPNHITLANIYLSLGSKEKSLEEFNTASTLIKSSPVYESLSVTYYLLGDIENSKKNTDLATFYPKHSFSLSLLGFALLKNKQYDKAIEEFNSAISNTPEYYLPYKGLGKVYMELGQKEKAIENFEKAASLNEFDKESTQILLELKK